MYRRWAHRVNKSCRLLQVAASRDSVAINSNSAGTEARPTEVPIMAEDVIKVRVEGELAYVGLNRPEKRNSINTGMLPRLAEAILEADQPEVRAIVLYGEGAVFSAGIDFTSLAVTGSD